MLAPFSVPDPRAEDHSEPAPRPPHGRGARDARSGARPRALHCLDVLERQSSRPHLECTRRSSCLCVSPSTSP